MRSGISLRKTAARQGGFSLIELMVALLLGMIVVAGLIEVLLANRKAYQLQEGNNFSQQTVRFAFDRIGYALRMADFWGGNPGQNVTKSAGASGISAGSGDCTSAWVLNIDASATQGGGVSGVDGKANFPISDCVNDKDYVKGSDVLIVRYAGPDGMDPAGASTIAAEGSKQVMLVSAIGQQAELFSNQEAVPATPPAAAKGRYVYKYHTEVFYLQPCSDPSGGSDAAHCDSGDDNGNPIPTLMRLTLASDGTLVSQPMVEGIEQLQFEYGLRGTDASKVVPEVYESADDIAAEEWARVISVRVAMVARSQVRDIAVPLTVDFTGANALSDDCGYKIAANGGVDVSSCTGMASTSLGDKPQQYSRLRTSQIMQVRNRIRG